MNQDFFKKRRTGILLHPTSLVGKGDAYRFIDFLAESGISLWQMLPLGPPHDDLSPYQCQSVHAANPALIDIIGGGNRTFKKRHKKIVWIFKTLLKNKRIGWKIMPYLKLYMLKEIWGGGNGL